MSVERFKVGNEIHVGSALPVSRFSWGVAKIICHILQVAGNKQDSAEIDQIPGSMQAGTTDFIILNYQKQ